MEEREEDYKRVRDRIFSQEVRRGGDVDGQITRERLAVLTVLCVLTASGERPRRNQVTLLLLHVFFPQFILFRGEH